MGMTIVERILARGSGRSVVVPGDVVTCSVDMTVLCDLIFAIEGRWVTPLRIHDADRVAIVLDHAVPAPTVGDAAGGMRARAFAKELGISRLVDVGHHGIVHQIIAERGLALPGQVLTCPDSHTCAAGALNVAARGLGALEILQIVCTGETWFQVPPTIRYDFVGELGSWISGKDVFLHIAGRFGDVGNRCLEYGGPGLGSLSLSDRRTIATQGAEMNADFSLFPADDVVIDYLHERTDAELDPVDADDDAAYEHVREIDLRRVPPMVARPNSVVRNALPAEELEEVKVDQCFVGSCANGQLEDLEVAASVLKNRKVATGVRLLVTPASQAIYLEAARRGYLATMVEAGAVVTNSTCGACFGYHMGVVGPGEVCLTASTRNFKGRMGSPDAAIFMASPATVAASAITGQITDPREIEP